MQKPTVSIIGLGAIGSSLALSLNHSGYRIEGLFINTPKNLDYLPEKLKREVYKLDEIQVINSDLIFICVKDDQILSVVDQLSKIVLSKEPICIHCSGALPSSILKTENFANAGSFHPNKSFSGNPSAKAFNKVYVDIESESDAVFQLLSELAENLGAEAFRVNREEKIRLHTAASMISNLTVALSDAALSLSSNSLGRKALLELLDQTVISLKRKGSSDALTGPVSRGDVQTIKKHFEVLNDHPQIKKIYAELSLRALEMAANTKGLDPKTEHELRKLLQDNEL